jgi:hypothetical protein
MARTQATTRHARRTARAPTNRLQIGELKPLQPNPRQRTERSAGMLVESLQRFGAARSIVIDEDNVVLAGNGTTDAAATAGIARVRVVEACASPKSHRTVARQPGG